MSNDMKYCYPESNVLINNFNIQDSEKLEMIERQLTASIQADIISGKISFIAKFDLNHLQEIHKHLFSKFYNWAGELRDVNIAKGNLFCLYPYIKSSSEQLFFDLKNKDNYLIKLPKTEFIKKLSYYMGEINALHPFREGNGRTQRIFFTQLAKNSGYILEFSKIDKRLLLNADICAMNGDYKKLEQLLTSNIKRIKSIEHERR